MNEDKLATTDKEIWEEARDRLKMAEDAESKNRALAKADLIFREGEQWDKKPNTSVSLETIELTINLTDPLVNRVVNNMKQQRPRIKCHPVADGADIETANVINGLIRHIEYRSNASIAYDTAGDLAATMGWGFWRVIIEYAAPDSFDMEIRILPIMNAFTVYLDPSSIMPDGSDSYWGIISNKIKKTEYRRVYGKEPQVSWNPGDDDRVKNWVNEEEIRIAEYFRIMEKSDTLYQLSDPSGRKFSKWKNELPSAAAMKAAQMTITDERESSRKTVELFKLNGLSVISRQTIPGTYVPIIRCQGNARDIDGEVYRRGMVRSMMDPQRMVNYGEVSKIKRLGLTPMAPYIAAEGQLDGHPEWNEANRVPYPVLTYKPITVVTAQGEIPLPPPSRQPPAQLEQGFAEFTGGMRANLNTVAGAPNEPGQDTQGEVVSGIAITARQGLSDQSHFQYYDNQTLGISHTGRIILEWIPHVYSEEKMQRIIGEDGIPQMVQVNQSVTNNGVKTVKNDLTVGRYEVTMDSGPGTQTKREAALESIMAMLGTPLGEEASKVAPDLLFRLFDDPYMQQIADRFAAMTPQGLEQAMEGMQDNAKSIIQALSKQLQACQQQLQEAESGLSKEKMVTAAKMHDAHLKAETEDKRIHADVVMNHENNQTKLHVEDKKAGAMMIDSENVRAHEKEMVGQKLLNQGDKDNG